MYFTVKLTWVILAAGALAAGLCACKYPKSAVPLTIDIAAAAVLAQIMHV